MSDNLMQEDKEMMNNDKLSVDEKQILKQEMREAFDEFPIEIKQRILDTKKEKLRTLYMIQGWAKENGHETLSDLLVRKIAHKEEKISELDKKLQA